MIRDTLGPTLRAMRKRAGLTLADVSGGAGVTAAQLSRVERGGETSLDVIERFASACGLRADLVFTPANVKVKRWGPEAHEAADLLEAATPEDRALFLTVLRRMAGGGR